MSCCLTLCLAAAVAWASPAGAASSTELARPAGLEPDIAFWRQIFGEVASDEALVHDNRHLDIVYEKLRLAAYPSDGAKQRAMDEAKARWARVLRQLADGDRSSAGPDGRRALELWKGRSSAPSLRAAAERVRVQQGLQERFISGYVRSGRWEDHIRDSMRAAGVPEELAALPHVESSYNPEARSFVGAAGMWQFMPSTGRRFMRIDGAVDERRDPYRSSEAAALLLRANYGELESWPLAVTAYNHGTGGMRRAMRALGTDDIETIVRNYDGPAFGFASRNFYVSFLAASEVERNAQEYFGAIPRDPPEKLTTINVPAYLSASSLEQSLGVPRETLQAYNPSLLPTVWMGKKYVPQGFTLRVPESVAEPDARIAEIAARERRTAQLSDPGPRTHRVRKGETLSGIAARYGTSPSRLASLNGLSRRNVIRTGQVLKLPGGAGGESRQASSGQKAGGPTTTGKKSGGGTTYVVRRGDNLAIIAKRTGVPQRRLMAINSIDNPNRIYPGQRLKLAEGG